MSRVQLALNVSDLDSAVDFYSKLFATAPAKRREGYANFAVADPPLKLVLFESPGAGGTLNHLGVEVSSTAEVTAARQRLEGHGVATAVEEQVTCCYAVQDKVWVGGPDDRSWEIYAVLADAEADADADADATAGQPTAGAPGPCGPEVCCSSGDERKSTNL